MVTLTICASPSLLFVFLFLYNICKLCSASYHSIFLCSHNYFFCLSLEAVVISSFRCVWVDSPRFTWLCSFPFKLQNCYIGLMLLTGDFICLTYLLFMEFIICVCCISLFLFFRSFYWQGGYHPPNSFSGVQGI